MSLSEVVKGAATAAATKSNHIDIDAKLAEAVQKLTPEEKAVAEAILKKATGEEDVDVQEITPAIAAYLLLNTNKHNRELRAARAQAYAKQMQGQKWVLTGQSVQFYVNGKLADGQHRLLAIVLSGVTVRLAVFYGLSLEAVDKIDQNTKRTASDAATLEGIADAKEKEAALKAANTYLTRLGRKIPFENTHELKEAIIENDGQLTESLAIGKDSVYGIVKPTIKVAFASAIAFVLLRSEWTVEKIQPLLKEFQSGTSTIGESAPLFVAGEYLDKNKELKSSEVWTVIIRAFIMARDEVRAVKTREFTEIKRKPAPDPKLLFV